MSHKILCIDDCKDIQEMICEYLSMEGYKMISAQIYKDAIKSITHDKPDLILLDLLMEDMNGLEMIKEIHAIDNSIPIIMISGRADDVDRIIGIEAGADDYIAKPFQPRELSARIKAVLKRSQKNTIENVVSKKHVHFDDWILKPEQFQAFHAESQESANLTTGEFVVLEKLTASKGQTLSRNQLFALLRHNDIDTHDRAVDIQITRIRAKLGDNSKEPKYIKTIRNIGYIFIAEIQE